MPSGRRHHIVPQQMIKRFTGNDGKVAELYKPTLAIGTRRRSPRSILWLDNFYRDCLLDFDAQFLQGIEQRFARYYPSIVGANQAGQLCGEGGAALIDWIAAMLCRTRAIVCLSHRIVQHDHAFLTALLPLIMNAIRSHWFTECQDILTRSEYRWKMKVFQEPCRVVLTDNPVCHTTGTMPGGQVTVVPLSKQHVLIGGLPEAVSQWEGVTIEQLNAFLAAWAEKSVFAGERHDLEIVKADLEGSGTVGEEEWCEAARKPFFGLPERMYSRQPPSGAALYEWWERVKASFGSPLFGDTGASPGRDGDS